MIRIGRLLYSGRRSTVTSDAAQLGQRNKCSRRRAKDALASSLGPNSSIHSPKVELSLAKLLSGGNPLAAHARVRVCARPSEAASDDPAQENQSNVQRSAVGSSASGSCTPSSRWRPNRSAAATATTTTSRMSPQHTQRAASISSGSKLSLDDGHAENILRVCQSTDERSRELTCQQAQPARLCVAFDWLFLRSFVLRLHTVCFC